MKNKLLSLVFAFIFVISAFSMTVSAENEALQNEIDIIVSHICVTAGYDSINDYLSSGEVSDWHAFSFARYYDDLDLSEYRAQVLKGGTGGAVDRQRRALALAAAGYDDLLSDTVDETIGKGGVMSYIFGLHLLYNGAESRAYTVDSVIDTILEMRLSDGGWAVSGDISNVDVTAMALQALAPHRERDDVSTAIDASLRFLSESQLPSGGFINYGVENAESTAQVIVALCALGRDPENDTDLIKEKSLLENLELFAVGNGGYRHTANGDENKMATVQALYAKIALLRLRTERSPLYTLTEVQTETPEVESSETETVSDTSTEISTEADGNITEKEHKNGSYKPTAVIIAAIVFAVLAVLLFALGKRNCKSFIALGVIFSISVLIIIFVDFSSPEDYYGKNKKKENIIGEVKISVNAKSALSLDEKNIIPEDGMILSEITLPIESDDTVYGITLEAARLHGLNLETAAGDTYVRGIGFVYEFDFGPLSGWTYTVNGKTHSVGCDSYTLSDGDIIEWIYTLEPVKFE